MPRKVKRPGAKPGPVPLPPGEAKRRKRARAIAYQSRPEYKEQRKQYAQTAKIRHLIEEAMRTCPIWKRWQNQHARECPVCLILTENQVFGQKSNENM